MPVAMTQRASTCLSLLALLSSFPLSLGDATHMSGSSLIGVSSVSEILDQFFKKQEMAGRKPPVWKQEAQAMIALVQSLKDINATTQATVDGYVNNIIDTLKADVDNTKTEQAAGKTALDGLKSTVVTELGNLDAQLVKVKGFSADSKACRADVASKLSGFYGQCTDNDRTGGGKCPLECGKPSTVDFELTKEAKDSYTCDFEAGETAKQCVAKLWAKVNLTRDNLTNKYNSWAQKKKNCEDHMARCVKCNPIWDDWNNTETACNGTRNVAFAGYCTLQVEQTDFCIANDTLYTEWKDVLKPAQEARVSEYSDLDFIICIFEEYLKSHDFSQSMVSGCTRKTAADFYSFAAPTGELTLPAVDSSNVPKCYGEVTHAASSPLWDMTGLVDEFTKEGYGSSVKVTSKVYEPAVSTVCP